MKNDDDESENGHVLSVPVTATDLERIEEVLGVAPFPQKLLLKLALRIGITAIQRRPEILMPYLAKQQPDP